MAEIQAVAIGITQFIEESPFQPGQPVHAESVGAAVITRANAPGTNPLRQNGEIDNSVQNAQKFLRITLDGTTVAFDSDDFPALLNLHVDGGALAAADRLRVVVIKRGVGASFLSILNRDNAASTPTATEFKTSGAAPKVLTLGDAGNDGESIDIWILDAADITSSTLVANVPVEIDTMAVIDVSVAAVTLIRLVSGGS